MVSPAADSRANLADLTAVRGLLALWVFAYHANLHLRIADPSGVLAHGYLGVDGFFVLSGLVLAHRHPDPRQTLQIYARFWWKRLIRLYPTHLFVLLLLMAALLTAKIGGLSPHLALRADNHELLLQLLLLNGWGFSKGWTWNYPSWSISAEWAGYLLFPALAYASSRLRMGWTVGVLVGLAVCLAVVDRISASGLNLSYHGALFRFFPEFLAGILLARCLRMTAPPPRGILSAVGLVLVALGIATADAVTVFGLWVLLWALAVGPQTVLCRIPGLPALGAISYPFYMVYAPVELVFARFWAWRAVDPTRAPLLWIGPMFLSVLLLAWVVARLVERPALRHLAGRRPDR